MALYSFGGVNAWCSAMLWAVQEAGMLPLLSCDSVKAQVEGFRFVRRRRGRPDDTKLQVIQKIR